MKPIIKICKKHGELTIENVKFHQNSKRCRLCLNEAHKKYRIKNKDKCYQRVYKWHQLNRKKIQGKYGHHRKEKLYNGYITGILIYGTTLKRNEIPLTVIEAKRNVMLLKRKIKEINK
jgi:hypothetical protein